jgi:hypothetical protein
MKVENGMMENYKQEINKFENFMLIENSVPQE